MTKHNPICPYCGATSLKTTGAEIYPQRRDLRGKVFFVCSPCDAYVGCHPGGGRPLGRLADATLRAAKQAAHRAFDPIWLDGEMRRGDAYSWLAQRLGIHQEDCHIGMFDVAMCERVVEICTAREFKALV